MNIGQVVRHYRAEPPVPPPGIEQEVPDEPAPRPAERVEAAAVPDPVPPVPPVPAGRW